VDPGIGSAAPPAPIGTNWDSATRQLARFLLAHPRMFVLTGAGCSTRSGIPDYRDTAGTWKRRPPVDYRDFMGSQGARQRYWRRSLLGWPSFARARPNSAHTALADLEAGGFVHQLVTQNVDGLHQRAGSRRVIDLHGRLDTVACQRCGHRLTRAAVQRRLRELNPQIPERQAIPAPDGDVELPVEENAGFVVPDCQVCGGILKPDVVFFGESVPRVRVESACARLREADALLVVGSSLMVYSGFRFCRAAADRGTPIAAINLGRTRADALFSLKVTAPCGPVLAELRRALSIPAERSW
jgi:NAD-dependent SIR2 family protein deacetylase